MSLNEPIIIRDAVFDKIISDKPNYIITDPVVEKTYYPRATIPQLTKNAHIKIVGMSFGADLQGPLRNPTAILLDLYVQIAIQKKVDPNKVAEADQLVLLTGQVMNSLIDHELVSGSPFLFQRIEQLKDDNGEPFSFEDLTMDGVFHSVFTAFYQHVRQPV